MALNHTTTGTAIAAAIKALAAAIPAGTTVTDAQLQAIWQAAVQKVYLDLAAGAEVAPGSFKDGMSLPVTGTGGPIT